VAIVFPVALFLLVPAALRRRGLRIAFLALPLVVVGLYGAFRQLHTLLAPLPIGQAIMESVAFSQYRPILAMLWHLIAVAVSGLLLGFRFSANDYPGAASHLAVACFAVALLGLLAGSDAATRRLCVALAVLSLGAYAMVAVGRSNVYLMFQIAPAVSARQLRYQYVGMIPLAILLSLVVHHAARPATLAVAVLLVWTAVTAHAWSQARWSIDQRTYCRDYVRESLRTIDGAIDAEPPGADVFIRNQRAPHLLLGPVLGHADLPGWAGLFVLAYPVNAVRGRRVHFIEDDPVVLSKARTSPGNRRLSDLLVEPEAVATSRR
jgi:hypothetical protein